MNTFGKILSVFLSAVTVMASQSIIASADTSEVDYSSNPGTAQITGLVTDTPADYVFSLPDSNRKYVMIDSYDKGDGTRDFFVTTDYSAANGIVSEALNQNRYKFVKNESYTWDIANDLYIWNPSDTNTLAGFINDSIFVDEMIDKDIDNYVVEHSYKFEPMPSSSKSIYEEVESRYAALSLSEIIRYKDRIAAKVCEYNVFTDVMTSTINSWWVRTPPTSGGAGAIVIHGTSLNPSWQDANNGWSKTIRPCFYISEEFFKNVKLDIGSLGKKAAKIINFPAFMSSRDLIELGYTEKEIEKAGINFPKIENAKVAGLPTVGSVFTADYTYSHKDGNEQGMSPIEWYRVDNKGNEILIDGANKETYILTQEDIGYSIIYKIVPTTVEGYSGVQVTSEKSDIVVEGECSTDAISARAKGSKYIVSLLGLKAKDENVKLKAVLNIYKDLSLVESVGASVGVNASDELSASFKSGNYVKFAVYNEESYKPMFVITDKKAPTASVEESDEFIITSKPIQNALVAHGKNEGFYPNDDVIIVIKQAGKENTVYIGADKLDENGNLEHAFSLGNEIPAGIFEISIISGNSAEKFEFNYSSLEVKKNILENILGEIDSPDRFADVVTENMLGLSISDKYIVKMGKDKLKLIGKRLIGKSYGEGTLSAFYEDISDAAAVIEITRDSKPSEVAKYYEDRYKFETFKLYEEYSKLKNKNSVFDMYYGEECESFEDVEKLFNIHTVIQMINEAESYGQIDNILSRYEEYIPFNLDEYKKSDISKVCLYVLKKKGSYKRMTEIEKDIRDGIKNQKSTSKKSFRGGGSSSDRIVTGKYIEPKIEEDVTTKPVQESIIFDDVPKTHWAYNEIIGLAEKNIVSGNDGKRFNPEDKILREEFVKMLVVATNNYNQDAECEFSDISKTHWAYKYLASAKKAGIINGKDDGTFGLSELITRQDMAVMVFGVLEQEQIGKEVPFADFDAVSEYAVDSVVVLTGKGIISGFEDNTFRPLEGLTRAEAAKVIAKLISLK